MGGSKKESGLPTPIFFDPVSSEGGFSKVDNDLPRTGGPTGFSFDFLSTPMTELSLLSIGIED